MKPQNLLIFKDYKIKLGDFGCCLKFDDDSTNSSTAQVRGVTKNYSTKEICRACENGDEVTKKELFDNDCYCLYQTFKVVQEKLEDLIPEYSMFNKMVEDLGDLKVPLKKKLEKWQKEIYSN